MTIEPRRKATQYKGDRKVPLPLSGPEHTPHCDRWKPSDGAQGREGVGQSAAIELLLWRRVSALPDLENFGEPKHRVSGDFLPKLGGKKGSSLCVSFECDSLSEELRRREGRNFFSV